MDTVIRNCQWLTPDHPPGEACAQPVRLGSSYCPTHFSAVYIIPERKRKSAALADELAGGSTDPDHNHEDVEEDAN